MRASEVLLEAGQALGPYVIVAHAGSGGMGEVYKARDTRLDRSVALKVIGGGLEDREEFRRRFAAEAHAIAALNHPHICTLYDTGHSLGRDFLVLEYLEGETLAQRLRRGAVPLRDAIGWGIEIADALDYAHRHGVVHRDLKPSNVLITHQGRAKLLDFGLSQLRAVAAQAGGISGLPTTPVALTAEGAIVGTLHYLAPERLDGRETDLRSDVFAFGALLYEMITGRKAFDEKNQARLIAAILSSEPPPIESGAGSADLQWVVQNCLVKDPERRWQSMGDVAKVLKTIANRAPGAQAQVDRRRLWIGAAAAVLIGATLSAATFLLFSDRTARARLDGSPISLSMLPPRGGVFAMTVSSVRTPQFAVAPDGHAVVFAASTEDGHQLWIRDLDSTEARALPGTEGASYPFWSPDSRTVAFFADRQLKKVDLTGRAPRPICEAQNGRGGAWGDGGTIVFSADTGTPLSRVDAGGGTPVPFTMLATGQTDHRWPQFLPDGRVLFFARSGDAATQGIYVASVDSPRDVRFVRTTSSSAVYSSGHLLFVAGDELMAQPLDSKTLQPTGEAVSLGLKTSVSTAMSAAVSVSREGVLATWSGNGVLGELVWFDAHGTRLGTVGRPDRYVDFGLSPDDRHLAISRVNPVSNRPDLAIVDLATGGMTALASSPATDATPVWSPDGTRIVFRSNRDKVHDLFERPAHGGGRDRLLYSSGHGMYPTDWSAEEGVILFHLLSEGTEHDIWALDASGARRAVLHTSAEEMQGQLSPGGRLAYTSKDQSGVLDVYVRPLHGDDGPVNVSVTGGFDPRWRADGRELFFISASGALMASALTSERPLRFAPARTLFQTGIRGIDPPYLSNFAVTRDAQRFLLHVRLQEPGAEPITITEQWPGRLTLEER